MTTENRNDLFLEHQQLIHTVILKNSILLAALKLEKEDVAQELAICLMSAIENFDAKRSENLPAHLWCKLQYEILNIKRRNKPHGITQLDKDTRLCFVSLDNEQPAGAAYELPDWDDTSGMDFLELFKSLTDAEIKALNLKMEGFNLKKASDAAALDSIKDKFTAIYKAYEGGALA